MPFDDYEVIDTTAFKVSQVDWSGSVIRKNFGGSVVRKIRVGPVYGAYKWQLSTDKSIPGNDYGLTINGLSRLDYYLDFFQRYTTGDTDVFLLFYRDKYWTVGLADETVAFGKVRTISEMFADKSGITLEYRRVPGETAYNPDGSIVAPTPFYLTGDGNPLTGSGDQLIVIT